VNCGGGEFGCEVDRESVEVMSSMVCIFGIRRVEVEKICTGQGALRSGPQQKPVDQHPVSTSTSIREIEIVN